MTSDFYSSLAGRLALINPCHSWHVFPRGHGLMHWARTCLYGRKIAGKESVDPVVLDLFAIFHDCARVDHSSDLGHGERAAKVVDQFEKDVLSVTDLAGMELLKHACLRHTFGEMSSNPTVGACWDSDRLDLARLGMTVDTDMLHLGTSKTLTVLDMDPERDFPWSRDIFKTLHWR